MIKLYLRLLHNATLNLEKQFFRAGLLLLVTLHFGNDTYSQCTPPPNVTVTPSISCGGVPNGTGPCNPLTASGADSYVWSPINGLYINCTLTTPYTGGNFATVYAAPTSATIYTVTGTVTATGCSNTATAFVNYTPPAPVVTPASVSMCLGSPPVKLKVSQGVPSTQAIWTPFTGLFYDPAAAIPYTGIPIDSVYTMPLPAGVYTYQVTTQSLPFTPYSFTNPAAISIPVGGVATAYPSNVIVSGLPISNVSVKSVVLNGFSHSRPEDIDILLQSPSGVNMMLMSDVGGTSAASNATYTLIDTGPAMSTGNNPTGSYRPTNLGTPDNFPTPGPGSFSQATPALTMFGNGNHNGTWKLFVIDDDGSSDQGSIANGFTINFDIAAPACTSPPRSVIVTVNTGLVITTQPADQQICLGSNATFNVAATGTGVSYNWQLSTNGGGSWVNLVNAAPYSGVNSPSLTITAPPLSMNGYRYRATATSATCGSVTSNPAVLIINPKPTVTIWASYIEILPTMTSTIFSSVAPNPAATYTWFYNTAVLPGANADTLLVDYSGLGLYELSVTDTKGCTGVSNTIEIKDSTGRMFIYPNPSTGRFVVRLPSERNTVQQVTLAVYNNTGVQIMTRPYTQTIPYERIEFDMRRYGKGLFWVEVLDKDNKRVSMTKVLVQ